MLTYYERYHLDTVEKIVSRWAPSSENDTKGYIAFVVNELGILDTMPLPHPRENPRLWIALVVAMAKMECGTKRIGLAEVKACEEGYHLLFD